VTGTVSWCQPYESAFNLLQKFAWSNFAGAREISQNLFGRSLPSEAGPYADLFYGDWIKCENATLPRGLMLHNGLADAHGHWLGMIARPDALKYCKPCLEQGFHTLLFQIDGLLKCPRHRTPLHSCCMRCGAPTAPLTLSPPSFASPFCCVRCGEALPGRFDPRRWITTSARRREIRHSLRPLISWLEALAARFEPVGKYALSHLSLTQKYAGESDSIVHFHIARSMMPLELPETFCSRARSPIRVFRVDCRSSSQHRSGTVEIRPGPAAIFGSIRRYLIRRHLSRHRPCLHVAIRSVGASTICREPVMRCPVRACALAVAFANWQLRHKFLVRQEAHTHDPGRFVESSPPRPDSITAAELLADFYFCVATEYVRESQGRSPVMSGQGLTHLIDCYRLGNRPRGLFATPSTAWAGATTSIVVSGDLSLVRQLERATPDHREALRFNRFRFNRRRKRPRTSFKTATSMERRGDVVWEDCWARPYESALSMLVKYVIHNPNRVPRPWPAIFPDWQGKLIWGTGLREHCANIVAGEAIVRGTLCTYAPRWRCWLTVEDRLRVRPECVADGYHSVFFQITQLSAYPMHERPLVTLCTRCNVSRRNYNSSSETIVRAFTCRKCKNREYGAWLASPSGPRQISASLITSKLEPLVRWIEDAEKTHRGFGWRGRIPIPQLQRPPTWDVSPSVLSGLVYRPQRY
jgi:hypothetical protein